MESLCLELDSPGLIRIITKGITGFESICILCQESRLGNCNDCNPLSNDLTQISIFTLQKMASRHCFCRDVKIQRKFSVSPQLGPSCVMCHVSRDVTCHAASLSLSSRDNVTSDRE